MVLSVGVRWRRNWRRFVIVADGGLAISIYRVTSTHSQKAGLKERRRKAEASETPTRSLAQGPLRITKDWWLVMERGR